MTAAERNELISRYQDGYREVLKALEGFPEEALASNLIPGKWSAREIVHHLADSETVSAIRLKRLLVEDNPVIQGYDQDAYALKLKYNTREIGPALDAFRSARDNAAQVTALMSDDDWHRAGTHSESGSYSVEDWLRIYAAHAHNHAAQIRRLRESMD